MVITEGMQPIQISAVRNSNYFYVKQPLRDILHPIEVSVAWTGENEIKGSVAAEEPLALVEIVAEDREVWAADPSDEFMRDASGKARFLIDYSAVRTVPPFKGTAIVRNASEPWRVWGTLPLRYSEPAHQVEADPLDSINAWVRREQVYLVVPEADVEKAAIDFDFEGFKWSASLKEARSKGMVACASEHNGAYMTLAPYDGQFHIPQYLNKTRIDFNMRTEPETVNEMYFLRVRTVSGKQFRSHPLMRRSPLSEMVSLRVYSDSQVRGVDIPVEKARIPKIDYIFSGNESDVLRADAGRPFWGSLGGSSAAVSGKGNITAIFRATNMMRFPEASIAPKWSVVDGRYCLKFDGRQTFLKLPRETLPSPSFFLAS